MSVPRMTAEGAIEFEALEAQAASLMGLFTKAGYERVAPAFIQPASLFLDRIGETLRARTYVFTDPDGEELCLRPEMTIPVCRVFLERPGTEEKVKFCYNGPAFRIQKGKPDALRPREFRQAGIEYFGAARQEADLEVLALTIEAVRSSGFKSFIVKAGHIGIFSALLNALSMPQRWRERLARAFWRPQAFGNELHALSRPQEVDASAFSSIPLTAEGFLNHLDARGIPFVGLRRPEEIVKRLQDKAADAGETPLPKSTVQLLESYLNIKGEMPAALSTVEKLFAAAKLEPAEPIGQVDAVFRRLNSIAGPVPAQFEAGFGRHFEYYSGLVFQIEVEGAGHAGQIAGGGRYDGLIRALSENRRDVPAVGAAIHTERLLAAIRRS
ncbi:MAG: ATP phosphoribosyltransferase regulatory subunit [Rhodomicrobium sp.]